MCTGFGFLARATGLTSARGYVPCGGQASALVSLTGASAADRAAHGYEERKDAHRRSRLTVEAACAVSVSALAAGIAPRHRAPSGKTLYHALQ
jgi:hypothetical protein